MIILIILMYNWFGKVQSQLNLPPSVFFIVIIKNLRGLPEFLLTYGIFDCWWPAWYLSWKKIYSVFKFFFRLRLKFSCMMELSDYPLDRQVCGMQISSCKQQHFHQNHDYHRHHWSFMESFELNGVFCWTN